jgi:hypothetical protein
MPGPQLTAVVQDLEQRRAQLTDGKCLDLVAARMPRPLAMEVRQAAKGADTTVSDWLMQAALEKIWNDEMKTAAREALEEVRKQRLPEISAGLLDEIIRDTISKMAKGK